MPCKVLVRMQDNENDDPSKNLTSCYKRGDLTSVHEMDDDIGSGIGLPGWGVVTITNAILADVQVFIDEWKVVLDWTIDNHYIVDDRYDVTFFSTTANVSEDLGCITLGMISAYFARWNIAIDSSGVNSVLSHFYISNNTYKSESVVFSQGFWGVNVDAVVFDEFSYDSGSGNHFIDIDYSATDYSRNSVVNRIEKLGGVVTQEVTGQVRFIINRNEVTTALRNDIISEIMALNLVRRRKKKLKSAGITALQNNGGAMSVTAAAFNNNTEDKAGV